jgi:hypothetical protein
MNALGADLIPDPTTAGDFCRRFSKEDVIGLMESINAVRPKLWRGQGKEMLGPIAYLDIDGTIRGNVGEAQGRHEPVAQRGLGIRTAHCFAGEHEGSAFEERLVERLVTYSVEVNGRLVVIENVPARVNDETGERFFSPETVERVQQIVREQRSPSRLIQTPVFDFAA